MKSFLQNTALIFGSLAIVVVIFEIGLRLTGPGSGNPFDRLLNNNDEYVGYRMIPGDREQISGPDGVYDVDIVSLGFKDERGFRDDGRDGPVHSVFFGDSFVWGYGVDISDSVSEQFESLTGKDAVNLGMTAFTSPMQQYRLFKQYAPELRAKFAFFGIFVGNDFGDSLTFDDWLLTGKQVSYPEWCTRRIRGFAGHTFSMRVRRFARKHSALFRFIADRIDFGFSSMRRVPVSIHEIKTDKLDLVLDSGQIANSMGPDSERQVTLVRRALAQIARVGKTSGTHPVAFVIPTKELVYQSYYPEGPFRDAEDVHYRKMLDLLKESGLDYIDLLPSFRKAVGNDADQLYFRVDGHWTPAGHALAAAELHEYVNKQAVSSRENFDDPGLRAIAR